MRDYLNLALYALLRFCLSWDLGHITRLLPVTIPCYTCHAPLTGRRQHLYHGVTAYYYMCFDCRPDLKPYNPRRI